MNRTTLTLPDAMHQRLVIFAQQEHISVPKLIQTLLDKALATRETARNERMYETLKRLEGIGDPEVTDASTTIDETLYGENGAWRGQPEE